MKPPKEEAKEIVEKTPSIEMIVVIGKFSDGKCRQILLSNDNQKVVLGLLMSIENPMSVIETPFEGMDIIITPTKIK